MPSQRQSDTPQPTPGHVRDYSQVADEELVVLTDDSTDTEWEKSVKKARRREETERREREHEAEHKAKHEEAKRRKAEEERLEAERRKRAEEEEEARRKKVAEEEVERQRQRAQARRDEATQRLTGAVYDINTAQKVPGASVVVTMTRRAPCTRCIASLTAGQCEPGQGEKKKRTRGKGKEKATEMEEVDDEWEVGGEDEPATPLEGPSGAGVHTRWVEWERERQLQAMERQAEAHETAALAFERMAEAAGRMVVAAEQTADEWALYHAWAEWAEMRRREDVREARMAELEHSGGGWKRPQSEVEDKNEEADEGAEGDNEEEEDVGGEKEGREGQEGGGEQAMEE
ncbi:hypothetical protein M404DRAFT_21104 [Pisolithus tinctorius Marx 270]|uniref:Uncharacterized protein n=1 Tax=Pisolithus tinctorius Marx 270 TaxID=870435 RepID=A0A0C3PQU2_PISTI|nr:hypothetical protein M404DRAFT_21104 [Pisolithus tinctorius Marx 270]